MASACVPTVLSVAGLTHAGRARQLNEDTFCVSELGGSQRRGPEDLVERIACPGGLVLGVYDGAGGNDAGDFAAATAARVVSEGFALSSISTGVRGQAELCARLVEAVTAAGERILAESRANAHRRGMGSTATVAAFAGENVAVGHVGDSRCYLLRGRELVQLTRDDTLLEEALRTGRLSPAEAKSFPHKNVLLQVLGTGGELKVGLSTFEARRGNVVLLCTDGLHGPLDDARIRAVLLRHREPGVAARVLLDEALREGGRDNVAVVVARVDGDALPAGGDGIVVEKSDPT